MVNKLVPQIDQWYRYLGKGQRFYVTAIDEDDGTIEVQHFDSDLEEISFEEWQELEIALSEEPENWSGAVDIGDKDDYGTEVTDTRARDWLEPGDDFKQPNK